MCGLVGRCRDGNFGCLIDSKWVTAFSPPLFIGICQERRKKTMGRRWAIIPTSVQLGWGFQRGVPFFREEFRNWLFLQQNMQDSFSSLCLLLIKSWQKSFFYSSFWKGSFFSLSACIRKQLLQRREGVFFFSLSLHGLRKTRNLRYFFF